MRRLGPKKVCIDKEGKWSALSDVGEPSPVLDAFKTADPSTAFRSGTAGTANTGGLEEEQGGLRTRGFNKHNKDAKPLVTVITVVYNCKQYIQETINSVKCQNYDNVEYIIIDGRSTDGTLEVIKENDKFIDFWISQKDGGIYDAMNKGLMYAAGEMIVFLNAGDCFYDHALGAVVMYSQKMPDADFFFAPVVKGKLRRKYNPWLIKFSFRFYTTHSVGFFIRRSAQDAVGLYNTKYKCSADYDLFYRLIAKENRKGKLVDVAQPVGFFRRGGFSDMVSFYDHLSEETKIRLSNGQNRIIVLLIFILRFIKNYKRL